MINFTTKGTSYNYSQKLRFKHANSKVNMYSRSTCRTRLANSNLDTIENIDRNTEINKTKGKQSPESISGTPRTKGNVLTSE